MITTAFQRVDTVPIAHIDDSRVTNVNVFSDSTSEIINKTESNIEFVIDLKLDNQNFLLESNIKALDIHVHEESMKSNIDVLPIPFGDMPSTPINSLAHLH